MAAAITAGPVPTARWRWLIKCRIVHGWFGGYKMVAVLRVAWLVNR